MVSSLPSCLLSGVQVSSAEAFPTDIICSILLNFLFRVWVCFPLLPTILGTTKPCPLGFPYYLLLPGMLLDASSDIS